MKAYRGCEAGDTVHAYEVHECITLLPTTKNAYFIPLNGSMTTTSTLLERILSSYHGLKLPVSRLTVTPTEKGISLSASYRN